MPNADTQDAFQVWIKMSTVAKTSQNRHSYAIGCHVIYWLHKTSILYLVYVYYDLLCLLWFLYLFCLFINVVYGISGKLILRY